MKGFKKCSNGHFYKEAMPSCPYCPNGKQSTSGNGNNDMNKTMVSGNEFTSTNVTNDGTIPVGGGDKTQVFGGTDLHGNSSDTHIVNNERVSQPTTASKRNLDRTFIGGISEPETPTGSEQKDKVASPQEPRSTRRIVGWIISYSLDNMGVDWRIYEGTNTIGRDPKNTITITKDPTISSEHVTILYRQGKFKIKDKMTANGTYINGQELEVEEAYDLNDGDDLRLGNTTFKFKSAE
jgi:hypothetical protein